jgi:predicted SAM-dependent methyltransferase
MSGLRLNFGCGMNRLDGYVNVDRRGEPDLRHDLEVVPWPWPDDSVSEVLLKHVLEHLGREPNLYLEIMKELYRICQDGATIRVIVPHHRHEYFFNDPTHVRAVTPVKPPGRERPVHNDAALKITKRTLPSTDPFDSGSRLSQAIGSMQ